MSTFTLKIIALTTMLIDHIGFLFEQNMIFTEASSVFRYIGRIAFPIYVFLIAEGCRHTKNINRYFLRMLIFSAISEIPYDLFFTNNVVASNIFAYNFLNQLFNPHLQNVFFTLTLGILSIKVYDEIKKRNYSVLSYFAFIPFMMLGFLLNTDYGGFGVAAIFFVYVFLNKKSRIIALAAFLIMLYIVNNGLLSGICACASLFFIVRYNNEKGKPLKWMFYAAYPVHILILYVINIYI